MVMVMVVIGHHVSTRSDGDDGDGVGGRVDRSVLRGHHWPTRSGGDVAGC